MLLWLGEKALTPSINDTQSPEGLSLANRERQKKLLEESFIDKVFFKYRPTPQTNTYSK